MSSTESKRASRLFGRAQDAAAVRGYQTHPDVAALTIERWRLYSNALIWVGVLFGLCWTVPHVQEFVSAGSPVWSIRWWTAWFVEPAIAAPLIGILWAEQIAGRYGVRLSGWPRFTKWACLVATYSMNTWGYWAAAEPQGIVIHSVPPLLVFLCAEVLPIVRERLTESVWAAHKEAKARQESDTPGAEATEVSDEGDAHVGVSRVAGVGQRVSDALSGVAAGAREAIGQGDTATRQQESDGVAMRQGAGETRSLPVGDSGPVVSEATPDVRPEAAGESDTAQATPVSDEATSKSGAVKAEATPAVASLSDMAERDRQVVSWLIATPDMSGAEIGRRVGATAKTGQRLRKRLAPVAESQGDTDTRQVSDATGDAAVAE